MAKYKKKEGGRRNFSAKVLAVKNKTLPLHRIKRNACGNRTNWKEVWVSG